MSKSDADGAENNINAEINMEGIPETPLEIPSERPPEALSPAEPGRDVEKEDPPPGTVLEPGGIIAAGGDGSDGPAEGDVEHAAPVTADEESPADTAAGAPRLRPRDTAGDTGFMLVTAALLLVILAAVCWAQPGNSWWLVNDPDRSIWASYMQAEERSSIAAYSQEQASIAANLSPALEKIGLLSAGYDPETSGPEWAKDMQASIADVRAETARGRLISPPAACAPAHTLFIGGINRIDDAMDMLEEGLPEMEPHSIRSSYQRLEEGTAMLQQALDELKSVNQDASG